VKKYALILLAVPLLWGCSKKSPTTTVQPKMIIGEISWEPVAEVIAEPTPDPAFTSARVHCDTVRLNLSLFEMDPGRIVLRGRMTSDPLAGTICSLVVSSNLGGSRGAVVMPGSFQVNKPHDQDTLPFGDVVISWTPSEGASWFELQVSCGGYDTLGRNLGWADTALAVYDTITVIPVGFLKRYPAARYLYVWAQIYSHTGSKPGWQTGNMVGEIRGFLIGTETCSTLLFWVGTPPPGGFLNPEAILPGPLVSEDRRRAFLRRAFGVD
jgi:hypothetical protein